MVFDCVACVAAERAPSSDDAVGAAGAAAFAAALEKNSSLQTLDLDGVFLFILILFVEIG